MGARFSNGFFFPRFPALSLAAALFLLPSTAFSQDSEALASYFGDKRITINVGFSPGGGYDVFSRLVARYAGKHLPGNPSFIVRNLPGGGGLRGLRATMRARPDGLSIGLLHPRFVQRELAGKDVPDFDLKTVMVLGSPSGLRVPRMWCARKDVATSWEEIMALGRPVTSGATAPGASFGLGPQFVEAVGGPIKMVYGYGGTSEIMAATDRGELDSTDRCTEEHVPRLFPEWIKKKILAPIFWWERKPSEEWIEQLGASMPPHILDIVDATEEQKTTLEVAIGFAVMNRIFVMPPGVKESIYQAWKSAFEATTQDPEFRKAAAVAGLEVGLATADDFRKTIDSYEKLSPEGKELLKELIGLSS